MKKAICTIIFTFLAITFALPAQSTPLSFSDMNRSGSLFDVLIDDPWNSPNEPVKTSYFHFDKNWGTITSAVITFSHLGNFDTRWAKENWYITGNNGEYIGDLKDSKVSWSGIANSWLTQSWSLNSNIIADIMSDGWFSLNFMENTGGTDSIGVKDLSLGFRIADDLVTAPVPEPATLFLLGMGLIGLPLLAPKKKSAS